MDEFHDIDRELDRLRHELSAQDKSVRNLHVAEPTDYWKRRLDEEKALWDKKMALREEEKKALESRLTGQQMQIDQYNQKMNEFEKKLENETKEWEQRLRVKEADLLIEKNRLLSEEKVKHAEIENRRLLEHITELNGKITSIREDHEKEKERTQAHFAQTGEGYEEKIKIYVKQLEILQEKTTALETEISRYRLEIEKTAADCTAQIKNAREQIEKLTGEKAAEKAALESEKAAFEREKSALGNEIISAKSKSDEEKKELIKNFSSAGEGFISRLQNCTGPLFGLVRFVSKHNTSASGRQLFKEIAQNIENEIETYSALSGFVPSSNLPLRLMCAATDEEYGVIEGIVSSVSADVKRTGAKTFKKDIVDSKPQALIVSPGNMALAKKVRSMWPFMPVIIFGELKKSRASKALSKGFELLSPPYASAEAAKIITRAAHESIAREQFWDKVKIKKSLLKPVIAACIIILAGAASIFIKYHPINLNPARELSVSSLATPYPQPTSITSDGQSLWVCDWFGQSIYKHSAGAGMALERIFYFPGKHLTALSYGGGFLWSADSWEKKIYKHNLDSNMSIIASYPAPASAISGLAVSANALWSCDAATGKIYRHKLDSNLTVEAEYASPGSNPSGLYYDGKNLWSIDSKTNKIYRHKTDENLKAEASFIPPAYEQKSYNLSGITASESKFYICSEKAGRIYTSPKDMLKEVN